MPLPAAPAGSPASLRGWLPIRTGGDAIAALVLGVLPVAICSSLIAALHGSFRADYQALGLVYLPA